MFPLPGEAWIIAAVMPQQKKPRVKAYFEGRYRKYDRELPQTVFFCPECKGRGKGCKRCDGYGKLTRDSVQELIARIALRRFRSYKCKFHGGGREDVNVRMLGDGRPFVFEVINPKEARPDLAEIETVFNEVYEGRAELLDLCWSTKRRVAEIKEAKCSKKYRARVQVDGGLKEEDQALLNGRGRIELHQRTPGRVAHRRADKERIRWMELVSVEGADDNHLEVVIHAAHGTYIKEAISGDDERTRPSLAGMLDRPCTCVELDVVGIFPQPDEESAAETVATTADADR